MSDNEKNALEETVAVMNEILHSRQLAQAEEDGEIG